MDRFAEFRTRADECRSRADRASPGEAPLALRHAADCWSLLAQVEEAERYLPLRRMVRKAAWVRDGAGGSRRMTLSAIDGGWALEIAGVANPMMFKSGAQAEAAARRIGAQLLGVGCEAEVEIHLRGGVLGGRFNCVEGSPILRSPRRRLRRKS